MRKPPQVNCDWSGVYSPDDAEEQLKDFKFKGPGWYFTAKNCLLVVPNFECEHIWGPPRKSDETYRFYFYNCPFSETIFAMDRYPPTRDDKRDE